MEGTHRTILWRPHLGHMEAFKGTEVWHKPLPLDQRQLKSMIPLIKKDIEANPHQNMCSKCGYQMQVAYAGGGSCTFAGEVNVPVKARCLRCALRPQKNLQPGDIKVLGFETKYAFEIDSKQDYEYASYEYVMNKKKYDCIKYV